MSQDKSKIYISESIRELIDIDTISSEPADNEVFIICGDRSARVLKYVQELPTGCYNFKYKISFAITTAAAITFIKDGTLKPITLCFGSQEKKIIPTAGMSVELELADDDMYICTIST